MEEVHLQHEEVHKLLESKCEMKWAQENFVMCDLMVEEE